MKSKKIVALIVAFAAFMAVATSGLAAVTTTTTYNTSDASKIAVYVKVDGVSDEVTYLVKSGSTIVYIDQQTAKQGSVEFDYKISKEKMSGLSTAVQFGTNGTAIADYDASLPFNQVSTTSDGATVTYYTDVDAKNEVYSQDLVAYGNNPEEELYAKVVFDTTSKEIDWDKTTGLERGEGNVFKVNGTSVSIALKATSVAPGVGDFEEDGYKDVIVDSAADVTVGDKVIKTKAHTKYIKTVGTPEEIGVAYNGYRYKAMAENNAYEANKVYAVRIITEENEVVDLKPYYYSNGEMYYADGTKVNE